MTLSVSPIRRKTVDIISVYCNKNIRLLLQQYWCTCSVVVIVNNLITGSIHCIFPNKPWQWVACRPPSTLKLKQRNIIQSSLVLLFLLIIFPLWHVFSWKRHHRQSCLSYLTHFPDVLLWLLFLFSSDQDSLRVTKPEFVVRQRIPS